jgi:hypothetical protein
MTADNPRPRPTDGTPKTAPFWRSRRLWRPLGYALTVGWMIYVLAATGADRSHPLFDTIFIVPLAGWILGLVTAWALRRWLDGRRGKDAA